MAEAPLLTLADICLTFGGDALFEGASMIVGRRARTALVGRNGSGKTTLLKIAAGLVEPDSGERFVHPGAAVSYLPQEPDFSNHKTVQSFLEAGLAPGISPHTVDILLEELDVADSGNINELSGGQAKRIALASVIANAADILLLDEPTNHLDLPAIAWLERHLSALPAAIVVISHDRRFLETTTAQTLWIDRGATRTLDQGFSKFEAWRDKILEEEELTRHKLGRKIAAEEHWMRYGVTARRKRNMRRVGELQTLRKELRQGRRTPGTAKMATTSSGASGKRAIVADDVTKSFGGDAIVRNLSIEIARGEKIGFVGPNGAGKTTLIKLLTGQLTPDEGAVKLGANIDIVTLDQGRASLKPDMRLADVITDSRGDWITVGDTKKHVASYLQDFLFAPEQWRAPVGALSGGERGRLALAVALAKPSNLLVLDEPTNDLDLETLDLLEDLLANYQGTLLLVSHDRNFVDNIVTAVVTTDPKLEGVWRRYAGGYDDMVAQRGVVPGLENNAPILEKSSYKQKPAASRKPAPSTKLSYKEKYALETLPEEIANLQLTVKKLQERLADPSLFERDPRVFNTHASELEDAKSRLAKAEDRWLQLELKREALKGA